MRVIFSEIILYSKLGLETLKSRKDKHIKLIIFYKKMNGLAPQFMLYSIQPNFQLNMNIILGRMAFFTVYHYVGLFFFCLHVHYGIIFLTPAFSSGELKILIMTLMFLFILTINLNVVLGFFI